jgi:hypothetical protein
MTIERDETDERTMPMTKQAQPNSTPQADHDPVADAEATVAALQAKREKLVASRARIEADMGQHSFAAHARSDMRAVAALDDIATNIARTDAKIRGVDLALVTAHEMAEQARKAEAQAAAKQKAGEAQRVVRELGECFPYLDKRLAEAARALVAIEKGFVQLRALGIGPSDAQVRLNITRALETWAQRGLSRSWFDYLRDGFKYLAPHERRTFSEYWQAVEVSLGNAIRQRLGEPPAPASQPPNPTKEERAA